MRSAAAIVALCVLLAGCSEAPADDSGLPAEDPEAPPLQGWIFDPAQRPLVGVDVQVLSSGTSTSTDEEGHYAFENPPRETPIVLVARLDTYQSGSKQVTVPVHAKVLLNFTLEPVPVKEPYHDVVPFNGFIGCQVVVAVGDNDVPANCAGPAAEQIDTFDFQADADLAGAIVEVAWDADTDLSASFHAVLETLGAGDLNTILDEQVGTSVLRLQVANGQAQKYYPEGGKMRLTVRVLPNVDESEAGAGVGLAVAEDFEVFASLFYVEPPPPTYTIQGT